MKVWSENYGCYVSETFSDTYQPIQKNVKLDITKCKIIINIFGFYELWLSNKLIKKLSFKEFMKYKNYVMKVERK